MIFGFCVEEDVQLRNIMVNVDSRVDNLHSSPLTTLDVRKAPWVLGQVCQRWKKVVMSTPYLWNVVELRYPGRRDSEGLLNYRCCLSFLGLVQRRVERAVRTLSYRFLFPAFAASYE
ncbi:hypothetical protein L218DRAFT_1082571, partial [Marasmius fiardii PR-910]